MKPLDISLYVILDPARALGRPLPDLARQAAEGGATLLQYRDKRSDRERQVDNAKAIIEAVAGSSVPLIVNDDPAIARLSGAAGVHLGREDAQPADARELLGPDAIVGLTAKTESDAREIPVAFADYVFVGGVFDTASKENPASVGLRGWREIAAIIRRRAPAVPVGAIAGITLQNVADVVRAGADGIAVISAVTMEQDVLGAARSMANAIREARHP